MLTNRIADESDLRRRAMAAYFRTGQGSTLDQPAHGGDVVEHEGRLYVVLSNVRGTLAVYRVRNDGMLRAMRRPPHEIAPDWYTSE
ncbi:MAG: hypothetical protein ACYCXA_13890 [Actinomycetes bacterium]